MLKNTNNADIQTDRQTDRFAITEIETQFYELRMRGTQALPSATTAPADARRCHASPAIALGVSSEGRGAVVQFGEQGASKGAPPGTGCGSPRREGLPTTRGYIPKIIYT